MTTSAPARIAWFAFLVLALQFHPAPARAAGEHGTLVRVATIYLSPDTNSTKMAESERGRELVVLENSAQPWAHVEVFLGPEKTVSGWILDKGFVRSTNADGDKIVFGEAADSEDEASRRHGRRGADQDALRLYYRVYDLFPNSPLAGEALYRAAFHLIDNKLCGEWQGTTKCPEKEADHYEKYANDRPQSPAAAEALYLAAKRRAATIDMYKTDEERKKAEEAKAKTIALTQKIIQQYPQSDYAARAQRLQFLVQQDVPTYGNAVD